MEYLAGFAGNLKSRGPAAPPAAATPSLFVFAHAGHWLPDLLTIAPVAVIAIWFVTIAIRDRVRQRRR